MPTIKISDLHPTGSELFSDSESYMNELVDSELDLINGASVLGNIVKSVKGVGKTAKKAWNKSGLYCQVGVQVSLELSNPINSF